MKFDVFIPYWGDVHLAKESVLSVCDQTHSEWQLTILDDQYPSREFEEWVKSLAHPKIRYVVNETNLGFSENFNQAISLAESDFLVIPGCDDIMKSSFLEIANETLSREHNIAFYQTRVEVIDEVGEKYYPLSDRIKQKIQPKRSGIYFGEKLSASLMLGDWLYFPAVVWKKEYLLRHGFDAGRGIVSDLDLVSKILLDEGRMYFDCSHSTFQYRRHKSSASSIGLYTGERFEQEREFFRHISTQYASNGWKIAARAARLHWTSRAHAASVLPKLIVERKCVLPAMKHIFF